MSAPAVRPRQLGGFNQGLGDGFDEHLEANDMQAAVQQKALGQQATLSGQPTTGGSALGTHHQAGSATGTDTHGDSTGNLAHAAEPAPPREVGTLSEELIKRPAQDVVAGLKSFLDVSELLGVKSEDDPQTKARKKQIAHNFEKLEAEDQAFVRKKYQEEMEKKQREQQEEEERKRQAEAAQEQDLAMPSSPQKGPVGPGGQKKPAAVMKLEQDRKTLGGPQNVG